uniref:Uncharacterized protein n=1 Tax=Labrus bergylta TaxID=56723 RepID=A0A3Q3M337_9LABR
MSARNPGTKLDLQWVSKVRVNTQAVLKRAQQIQGLKTPKKQWQSVSYSLFVFPSCRQRGS